MINKYEYGENKQLSEHFNTKEFRCKCGRKHEIVIDSNLIDKLERLYTALGAAKGIITSGYRCMAHDIKVGGNGGGQHTIGRACDIIFYDKKGQPISSKTVSCKAQDLGFGGIANINSKYTYTHLDVRTAGTYRGDETKGTLSVTKDFYSYYGISKDGREWDYKQDAKIKELQQILNSKGAALTVDGIAGEKTLAAVKKYIIENGDSGQLTKWTQERLNNLGFDCGKADGIAGNKTMNAIAEFQKANNLGVGYLGGGDWYYLIK